MAGPPPRGKRGLDHTSLEIEAEGRASIISSSEGNEREAHSSESSDDMRPKGSSDNTEEQTLEKRIQMVFQLNRYLLLLKHLKVIQCGNLCCCCSVAMLYPTLRNPMEVTVLHHVPEFAQTHVH